MLRLTDDLRITQVRPLVPPAILLEEIPISESASNLVSDTRLAVANVIDGIDPRLVVVVGPCSIHDTKAALEYAEWLRPLAERYADHLVIIMRSYFEKPRTSIGWKGLINDPDLDESFHVNKGLRLARKLLLDVNNLGLPTASEYLDTQIPQHIADLTSWVAIGARTTESQVHRELASGLSCPVGFKNGTDGNIRIAVDAIKAASARHHFISITKSGHVAVFKTAGNEDCHVILRGGKSPNYDAASVDAACRELASAGLAQRLMVDFSHANSSKQFQKQLEVGADVAAQLAAGERRVAGVMIESHINPGRQDLLPGKPLEYGVSITDACLGWSDTVNLLETLAEGVRRRRVAVEE